VKNLFSIEGKIALVTGSTGGLGFAFARGMAQHGARVILNGRNAEKLESRMRDLEQEGLKASGYVFDVSRADEVKHSL
jgi:gluconate 5-dehydrogenase